MKNQHFSATSNNKLCLFVGILKLYFFNSYLFWTEWGKNPCIGRARLDGSDQVTLVNSGIAWPNGITIDYEVRHRLFPSVLKGHCPAVGLNPAGPKSSNSEQRCCEFRTSALCTCHLSDADKMEALKGRAADVHFQIAF